MSDLYTIKTEILKNGKLVDSIIETELESLPDYQINHLADVYFNLNIKEYNNGIYAKIASILEYKYSIALSEDAIRMKINRRQNKKKIK